MCMSINVGPLCVILGRGCRGTETSATKSRHGEERLVVGVCVCVCLPILTENAFSFFFFFLTSNVSKRRHPRPKSRNVATVHERIANGLCRAAGEAVAEPMATDDDVQIVAF